MNVIDIYRAGMLFTSIKPDDNSIQSKRIMGENQLQIQFRSDTYINFKINDYCTVFLEKYVINKLPSFTKRSNYLFEYDMILQAEGFDLDKINFLFLGSNNELKEGDFSLRGNADTFIDLIIANANRAGSGWIKGQVIPTDYIDIAFSSERCYNALVHIAAEFKTEFSIEGKTIHLTQRSNDTGITLKHGRFKGLYDLTRQNVDNSSIITRLYASGSDKNLPSNYRAKRLKMPVIDRPGHINPDGSVTPPSTDPGDYIELNTGEYGIIESSQIFEDIFPSRTGKITSVNAVNVFKFFDNTLDFNLNTQIVPGISRKVVFNTGQLAGYTFEISAYDDSTKEITILKNNQEKVLDLPSADFKPAIGDTYILVDIIMPDSYVTAAEQRLKNKALEALAISSVPQLKYTLNPDPVFLERKKIAFDIFYLVWVYDQQLEIQRQNRIISFNRNIVSEFAYRIEIADVITNDPLTMLQKSTTLQGQQIGTINQQVNLLNENNLGDLPVITDTTNYSQVYIHNTTGKLARKV